MTPTDRRRPSWVYGEGSEPDYRFSFANERTFLAWIRTALALVAGGVAVDVIDLDASDQVQHVLAVVLVASGLVCAGLAWLRWARAERAMRLQAPLPSSAWYGVLAAAVVVVAGILALIV